MSPLRRSAGRFSRWRRRSARPCSSGCRYVPIRKLQRDTRTLMLLSHHRGPNPLASVFPESVKTMMKDVM
jgi:hypothetical protein